MGTHDNIHIPKESWPRFTWFVIEFFIVVAVANVLAYLVVPSFEEIATYNIYECEQESHEIKCALSEEAETDEGMLNWIYWGIVAGVFITWYIIIRGFIIKKPILGNR